MISTTSHATTSTDNSAVADSAVREVLANEVTPADYGLYEIPLARIRRNPSLDPRKHRNKARYERMCASFKVDGIMQAITVRPVERDENGTDLEVVAGNTRFDGANEVGLTTIPAQVRYVDAKQAAVMAGIENMERQDLSPVEEGIHAARLLTSLKNDHDEVMKVLGWSRTKLNSRIMLTHVTDAVQDALVQGDLKIGHVELLAGIPKANQDKIATKIISEGYSVTITKEKLAKATRQLGKACFDLSECQGCQYNSSSSVDLFATTADMQKDFCSNAACWDEKTKKHLDIIVTDTKESFGTVHLATDITDDGFTALETNGENGVGKAQKAACASCEHYGAVVSTTFGSEGSVREGLCFNLECHGEKVTAYRNLQHQATQAAQPTSDTTQGHAKPVPASSTTTGDAPQASGNDDSEKKEAPAAKEAAPITPATLKKGIKREAMTRFQTMGQDAIAAHPHIGTAIALLTLFKDVSGMGFPDWVKEKAKATLGELQVKAKALPAISDSGRENGATLLARLTAEELCAGMAVLGSLTVWRTDTSEQFEKHAPNKSAMLYTDVMNIDSTAYPTMTDAYMKAQTKAGLIEDCKQSGLAEAYDAEKGDKAFATLAKGKAKDLIEAISGFKQFDWSAYEPMGFAVAFYKE
jgi:PRTRC genetic system ParB family protein